MGGQYWDEHRHHVLARRRHGRIDGGGNQHIDVGILRPSAGLPVVVGPLHAFKGVGAVHVAEHQGAVGRNAVECRQAVQRDVQLARRAANLEVLRLLNHRWRQVAFIEALQEGALRVQVGNHQLGPVLGAVGKRHPGDAPALDDDAMHVGVADDLAAEGAQARGQRIGHRAHAAPGETPGADVAIDLAHVVVQQHVGGSRRVHPQGRADDAAARQVRLDDVGFKVLCPGSRRCSWSRSGSCPEGPLRPCR